MTGTCSICRELLVGKSAPALHEAPQEFEWRELLNTAQKHFVKRHAAEFAQINLVTTLWVHYLLSLHLLFTDENAIALQDSLHAVLNTALNTNRGRVEVVDVIPASAQTIDATTLLEKDAA